MDGESFLGHLTGVQQAFADGGGFTLSYVMTAGDGRREAVHSRTAQRRCSSRTSSGGFGYSVTVELTNEDASWATFTYSVMAELADGFTVELTRSTATLASGDSRHVTTHVELADGIEHDQVFAVIDGTDERLPCRALPRPSTVTVVIPALNEEAGIGRVLRDIPVHEVHDMGFDVEILVIDNGSSDRTRHIADEHGVTVICQPVRGYGNAYKAGFANATGDVIVTGDADCTYPFAALPGLLRMFEREELDFLTTDRLTGINRGVMSMSHRFGNWLLTSAARLLFGWPFKDSQSGMWLVRRSALQRLDIRSSGMPFSQEVKLRAWRKGLRCDEAVIEYGARAGDEKLNTVRDGVRNLLHLLRMRMGY